MRGGKTCAVGRALLVLVHGVRPIIVRWLNSCICQELIDEAIL